MANLVVGRKAEDPVGGDCPDFLLDNEAVPLSKRHTEFEIALDRPPLATNPNLSGSIETW